MQKSSLFLKICSGISLLALSHIAAFPLSAQSGFSSGQSFLDEPDAQKLDNPEAVFNTDVDGDGDEDLIAIGSFQALLYLNKGDGSFAAGTNIGGLSASISCATLFDGNGDGRQDLAIGYRFSFGEYFIGWCRGNSSGFDAIEVLNTSPIDDEPNSMTGGNILGTPAEELVVAMNHFPSGSDTRIRVYDLDLVGISWAQYSPDFTTVGGYHTVEVLDLDNDGQNEIIATAADEEAIKAIRYLGGGSFAAPVVLLSSTDVGSTRSTEITRTIDWDNDGLLDLLWSDLDQLVVNINTGSGFAPPIAITPSPTASNRFSNVLPYDVDGDGDEDLILQRSESNYLSWVERTPTGTGAYTIIDDGLIIDYDGYSNPLDQTLRLADLDGDGITDLIAVGQEEHVLAYYPGQSGGFGVRQLIDELSYSLLNTALDWVELGDFDNDGDRDLILIINDASDRTDATIGYENTGIGWERHVLGVGGPYFFNTTLCDVDNDGLKDIAYYDFTDFGMLQNAGDWSVDTVVVESNVPGALGGIASGDLNSDGVDDLILQRNGGGTYQIVKLLNDGNGEFAVRRDDGLSATAPLRKLNLEDLNGDGAAELFGANTTSITPLIHVLPNRGNGKSYPERLLTPGSAAILLVTPIELEPGRHSLIARNGGSDLVLFRQRPGGSFSDAYLVYEAGSDIEALAAADLDGDGIEDILLGTRDGLLQAIQIDGFGGIAGIRTLDALPYPLEFVGAEDINGDGKPDPIAVAQDFANREMRWYINMLPSTKKGAILSKPCTKIGPGLWSMPTANSSPWSSNPAFEQTSESTYHLMDAAGRVIHQGRTSDQSIALPYRVSAGSHWLVFDNGQQCRIIVP